MQPFIDVNKRTSRLAANLPLLQHNLQPLSFVDLPREHYTAATLSLYEERRIEPLRDVYLWAYQRSAERYRAITQSLGQPDPFRLRYRDTLRELVRLIVLELPQRVTMLVEPRAPPSDRLRLQVLALQELRNLNEGTYAIACARRSSSGGLQCIAPRSP